MLYAILGFSLIALPIVVIFIVAWKLIDWKDTLLASGVVVVIAAVVSLGAYFLTLAGILP